MFGFLSFGSGGGSERRSGYPDGNATVLEAIEEGIHEWFALEEIVPLGVVEIGCDDGRFSAVPLVHELEEGVDLFGIQGEVPQFIDDEKVVSCEAPKDLGSASVGKGCVEFVQEILGLGESSSTARHQGLSQETDSRSRFAGPRISNEDDILSPIQERE